MKELVQAIWSPHRKPIYVPESEMMQGTDEWLNARAGVITGTSAKKIFTFDGRTGVVKLTKPETRNRYMFLMIKEITKGIDLKKIKSDDIDRGNELEPEAREMASALLSFDSSMSGVGIVPSIEEFGFVYGDDTKRWGMSPDGVINYITRELLEIKCPQEDNHWFYVASKETPKEYEVQCNWNAAVSQCTSYRFMSYAKGEEIFFIQRDVRQDFIDLVDDYLPDFIYQFEDNLERVLNNESPRLLN